MRFLLVSQFQIATVVKSPFSTSLKMRRCDKNGSQTFAGPDDQKLGHPHQAPVSGGRHFDSACFVPTAENALRKNKRIRKTAFPTENLGVPPEELEHNFFVFKGVGQLVSTSDLLPDSSDHDTDPFFGLDEEFKNKVIKTEESSDHFGDETTIDTNVSLEQQILTLQEQNRRILRENRNLKLRLSRVTAKYKKCKKLLNKKTVLPSKKG